MELENKIKVPTNADAFNLTADLRAMGEVTGGPRPFSKADRSRFLSALDEALVRLRATRP